MIWALIRSGLVALLVLVTLDAAADQTQPQAASAADPPAITKTGKERLGVKWADPQRVNDCGVPPEKRDPKRPRPGCAQAQPKSD